MNKEEFYKLIEKDFNIIITDKQKQDLEEFCNLLLEYNKNINITAINDEEGVYLKHFYDSLSIVKIIDLNNYETLLDIGSGGGFPGIVLKICFPKLHVTLLDSNHKKSDFQRYICEKLDLKDISIINDRAEKYYLSGNKYDIVVARAVAVLNVLSELCIPFSKVSGYFIAMKANIEDEVKNAEGAIEFLGGTIENIITFDMPYNAGKRSLIKVKHINETKDGYPRAYDRILKKPLK